MHDLFLCMNYVIKGVIFDKKNCNLSNTCLARGERSGPPCSTKGKRVERMLLEERRKKRCYRTFVRKHHISFIF